MNTKYALEEALELWCAGWKQARRPAMPPEWRAEYFGAIVTVGVLLYRFDTLDALVAAYYQTPHDIDAALDAVIYPPSGHILNGGVIEDAAYWQRASVLIQQAAGATL